MKILIPTAKELNKKAVAVEKVGLSEKTKIIIEEIASKSSGELAKIYKIKEEKAKIELERWGRLAGKQNKNYKALELFNGLMYRNIDKKSFNKEDEVYIKENIFITSSLYGIINAFEPIAEHRLDFLQNIKVNDQTLKSFWKEDYDRSVGDESLVISLLSSEFEEVFSRKVRDKFIKINFMEEKDGVLKVHSTISKKARGKFLTQLIKRKVRTIEELKKIDFDNFKYQEEFSKERILVFVAEG
ncbi:peroxide stress protein YaaA [Gemella cuniculi]|uniref:peroxide stress protein YaaA n=1 Tax=Gemella cuniculi TaxID=150240 RepID=UPI0004179B3C|nr:peroxide stress protein YaaA [Gemella cuniculi]